MHIDELYDQANAEVADVSNHLQQKWERGSRIVLAVLVFLFAPIGKLWEKLFDLMRDSLLHISIFCVLLIISLGLSWWFWPTLIVILRRLFKRYRRLVAKYDSHREIK
ncbi:MAG: hypothetical protein V1844_27235 [Pseudomonadota bacterium]